MNRNEADEFDPFGFVSELPFPIALVTSEYLHETNPFIKLHRLTDAAETLTRFVTMVLLSDVLRQRGKFPENLRKELTTKIERPTFGAWKDLCQQASSSLPKRKGRTDCFVPQLPSYVRETLLAALGSTGGEPFKEIIALRNLLAHGGRLSDTHAMELLERHRAPFESLLRGLTFLGEYLLVTTTLQGKVLLLQGLAGPDGSFPEYAPSEEVPLPDPEHVILLGGDEVLDLFPLHAFSEVFQWRGGAITQVGGEAAQLYLRLSDKGYLEFTTLSDRAAFGQQRGPTLERFRELYQLEEWRRLAEAEREARSHGFDETVAELTDVFVGREGDLREAKQRLKELASGVLCLSGEPGVGKSALMARLILDYRNAPQHYLVIPYFFRLGQPGCSTEQFLQASLSILATELEEAIEVSADELKRRAQFVKAVERFGTGQGSASSKKLLFLIDGLDEINRVDSSFTQLIIAARAPNVVWLCGGRRDPAVDEVLRRGGAQWIFPDGLPELDESGIRAMLTIHLDRLKYELFARDVEEVGAHRNRLVDLITEKSRGLPLYVRMAVDDLRQGIWTLEDEDKLPDGLEAYYEQILERLKVDSAGGVLTPVFALLAWAKEPVTEASLKVLLADHHLSRGARWDETFSRAMAYGHMMLRASRISEGEPAWTFYHESFREHLWQANRIAPDLEWAQEAWLRLCAQWSTLNEKGFRGYALQHYPEHLLDAKLWADLFALARSKAFQRAQRAAFHNDPNLPLRTVRAALEGATQVDDAGLMAEFMLRHAREVLGIRQESPLEALRQGSLERALKLADLQLPEPRVIWHLLLAWELADLGREEQSRATLARLMEGSLPIMDHFSEYARYLVRHVIKISEEVFIPLQKSLLDDHWKYGMDSTRQRLGEANKLVQSGETAEARETLANGIYTDLIWIEAPPDLHTLAWALIQVGLAQAAGGDKAGGLKTLATIIERVTAIETPLDRVSLLGKVSVAQAHIGAMDAAKDTLSAARKAAEELGDPILGGLILKDAKRKLGPAEGGAEASLEPQKAAIGMKHLGERVATLVEIAQTQCDAGDTEAARATLYLAKETAMEIEDPETLALKLRRLAEAQSYAGDEEGAKQTLQMAIDAARKIEDERFLTGRWLAIAQAEAGDIAEALETAKAIRSEGERAGPLRAIAIAQAEAGMTASAIETAEGICDSSTSKPDRYWVEDGIEAGLRLPAHIESAIALARTAAVQAHSGRNMEARQTFSKAIARAIAGRWEGDRSEAFCAIAESQIMAGLTNDGIRTALGILSNRQEYLPRIGMALVDSGDRDGFKDLLIEFAQTPRIAYTMCAQLARLYPDQASAVASVLLGEGNNITS